MHAREPRPTSTTSSIIYDAESGEVLHVHVEPAELRTPAEEILEMVGAGERRLDVLRLPSERLPDAPFRVQDGRLTEAGEDAGMAGGGIARQSAEPAIERRYLRRRS